MIMKIVLILAMVICFTGCASMWSTELSPRLAYNR
jgi:uncharacterized protein YceK